MPGAWRVDQRIAGRACAGPGLQTFFSGAERSDLRCTRGGVGGSAGYHQPGRITGRTASPQRDLRRAEDEIRGLEAAHVADPRHLNDDPQHEVRAERERRFSGESMPDQREATPREVREAVPHKQENPRNKVSRERRVRQPRKQQVEPRAAAAYLADH
jgi:hypothetical protein